VDIFELDFFGDGATLCRYTKERDDDVIEGFIRHDCTSGPDHATLVSLFFVSICSICAEAQRRPTVGRARIVHYVTVQLGTHDKA
jgi:hypothetical protein